MADVKKLKIDGTNYDVKIPSENVKLMTGYSKGSSTNAITPSDSLNSAVGKLECRADANQANVLYAINTGVKNALVVNDREESGSGTIKFSAKNGVVTVTGTAGSTTSFFSFNFTGISGRFKLNGCPSGGSDNTYLQRIYTADGSLAIAIDRGSGTAEFTLDPNVSYQWTIRIQANYAIQNSLVFKPMLYQADTDGSTFQTGALPNSDLTRLEAEDRNALIEQVDSGAKNQLKLTGTDYNPNMVLISWDYDNGSVTVTGTSATTAVVYIRLGTWVAPEDGEYYLVVDGITSTANILVYDDGNWATYNSPGQSKSPLARWTKGTSRNIFLRIDSGVVVGTITVRPMICTKADFDVSQKFVPYSLPNTTITPALIEQVDAGAKNILRAKNGSTTSVGVTFTLNSDGSITANGTATGQDAVYTIEDSLSLDSNKSYWLSTGVTGASASTYFIDTYHQSWTNRVVYYTNGELSNNVVRVRIIIHSGTTVNNVTFRPMICTKDDWNVSQKYVPYRYPLTPVVQSIGGQFHVVQYGNIVTVCGYISNISISDADTDILIGTLDSKISKPSLTVRAVCSIGSYAYKPCEMGFFGISSDTGNIYIRSKTVSGTASVYVSCCYTVE